MKTKRNNRKKKIKKIEEKQLAWILGIIVLSFILFLGTYSYIQSQKHFTYAGVEWEKTQDAGITYWHSRFKLGEGLPTYNAWLRYDPRKNKIPIEGSLGGRDKALITYDDSVEECKRETSIMGITQGVFLSALNIETDFSYVNPIKAETNAIKSINCSDSGEDQTVFLVRRANETKISQSSEYPDCYYYNIQTCEEAIKIGERFIIGVLGKTSGEKI